MTSRAAFRGILALSLSLSAGSAIALTPHVAFAQTEPTPQELQAARELFQEAYKDEQEKRYDVALEKFKRVAQVKESAQVRYRIATVLEALGRYREARDAYRACAAMKPNLPPNQQNVADSAAEKALAVDKKIPKVVVTISGDSPPADARVTIDGAPVPTGRPVEQDPGEHTIQASATGMKPFEQKVTLPENGSQIPATVAFEPLVVEDKDKDKHPATPPRDNTVAWIAIGGGAALLTTGVILLFVREGAISDIKDRCPVTTDCPRSNQDFIEGKQDTANVLLPVSVGLSVVGAAVAGYGVYRLMKKPPAEAAPAPAQGKATGSIHVDSRYVAGGAMLGVAGTF